MKTTRNIVAALALAGFGQAALAGSLADPVIEPVTIVEDATSSSSGTALVALLAVVLSIPVLTD